MSSSFIAPIASLRLLLTACLTLLVVGSSGLQGREIRTIYLPGGCDLIPKAYLVGKETSIKVELPTRNLSSPVSLPKGDLILAALPSPPTEEGEIPRGAPQVKIPESWTRCILIFLGDRGNSVFPVRVMVVNASNEHFPVGSTIIYNLSNTTILGQFGKKQVRLEPGKSKSFSAPIDKFGGYPVAIDCLPRGEQKPRAVCRSFWQHDPESRQILFVIPQEGTVLPRVWGVLDRNMDKDKNDS